MNTSAYCKCAFVRMCNVFLFSPVYVAEPQLMLTAGPGMMGPGFNPAYPAAAAAAAYNQGMAYQAYGM